MRFGGPRSATRTARLRSLAAGAVLVVATVGVVRLVGDALDPDVVTGVAGTVEVPASEQDLNVDKSFPPLIDGPARPATTVLPDEEVATTRTWFAAGTWWAVLPEPTSGVFHIWGLAGPEGPWIDTGTLVDDRPFARIDVAWTGSSLVVSSTGSRDYRSHALRVNRFTYAADGTWTQAPDHPVEVTTGGAPGTRMAVTPEGEVWLARLDGTGIEVTHTEGATTVVAPWTGVDVEGAADDVGGLDLVTEGDSVTLVWRSLTDDQLVVARRVDAGWDAQDLPVAGVAGAEPVDAAVAPATGDLLALVPTTSDPDVSGDQAASLLLATLPSPDGALPSSPVAVVARSVDAISQPALVVEDTEVRVFGIVDPTGEEINDRFVESGIFAPRVIVEKTATLPEPSFVVGSGRRLVAGVDGFDSSRPLVPSGPVAAGSGLILVVSSEEGAQWATFADGVPAPPEVPRAADASQPTVLVEDTFDSLPIGGPGPTRWRDRATGEPAGIVESVPGLPGRSLRLGPTPEGADPVDACRTIPELDGSRMTVEAVMRVDGTGGADARLLTVRGPDGSVASVRQNDDGLIGYLTTGGRVNALPGPRGDGVAVSLTLDLAGRTTDVLVQTLDGQVLAQVAAVPWLVAGPPLVEEVCVRPAPGAGTTIAVDSLKVTLG